MKITLNERQFVLEFRKTQWSNTFSENALIAIFEYIEERDLETVNYETEFDAGDIACNWTEYADLEEYNSEYGTNYKTLDDLRNDNYIAIELDNGSFVTEAH